MALMNSKTFKYPHNELRSSVIRINSVKKPKEITEIEDDSYEMMVIN